MPEMKCHRGQSCRPLINFFIGQASTPLVEVFLRGLEGVQHGALDGGSFRQRAAQPGFGLIGRWIHGESNVRRKGRLHNDAGWIVALITIPLSPVSFPLAPLLSLLYSTLCEARDLPPRVSPC